MKLNSFKIRSSLWGTAALAITSVLFCMASGCGQEKTDTDNLGNPPPIVSEVNTTWVTSTTTSTETTSLTSTTTTTTTTAVTTMMMTQLEMTTTTIEEAVEEVVEIELTTVSNERSESETEIPEMTTETYTSNPPITEYERILLCNLVGREYGSDYVPIEEKAKVVAVVINRVNSPQFPNSIYDVVTQPYQFSGYLATDSYSYQVTNSVVESVDYYFSHQEEFGNWLYFEGDGTYNYFR